MQDGTVLAENRAVRERRAQRSHPNHPKPEVVARAPNEVWSWDITRLLGPERWQYFYLYVILDIFSRYVTGWMVADRETAGLAGPPGEGCRRLASSCPTLVDITNQIRPLEHPRRVVDADEEGPVPLGDLSVDRLGRRSDMHQGHLNAVDRL